MQFQQGTLIPLFLVKVFQDLRYETYHLGTRIFVPFMTTLRKVKVDRWSILINIINFIIHMELDTKKKVILEHAQAMSAKNVVSTTVYSPETIIRAFCYFATNRALYRRLLLDYQFPSESLLTELTSSTSKLSEEQFITRVFNSLEDHQKLVVINQDEVHVKKMLLYSGGSSIP